MQALLAARIDRLAEREKQVLQTAAVIGKEFPRPLLRVGDRARPATTSEAALSALARPPSSSYEQSLYPVAEYAFKHPLTQEVALARSCRSAAAHARRGGRARSRTASRTVSTSTPRCWRITGRKRASRCGRRVARARGSLGARQRPGGVASPLGPGTRAAGQAAGLARAQSLLLEVYPALIDILDRLGAEAAESEAVFAEAIPLARRANDRRAEALIEAAYAWLKTGQNQWSSVVEHATRAMTLADAEGDRSLQLFARWSLGRAVAWQGKPHESEQIYNQAVEIGGGDAAADIEVLGWRLYVECLSIRSAVQSVLGRPHEALEFAERFPVFLRRSRLRADMAQPATDRIWPCWIMGDAERARRYTGEALQIAERFGADRNVVYALAACGVASCLALRWDEGDALLERARQRIAATGAGREWSMLVDGFQALCRAGIGDCDRSLGLARRGIEQANANALDWPRAMQGALAARVFRMLGARQHQGEIETLIAVTLDLIRRTDMKGMLPLILLERAGLARLRGDAEGMARDLAEARRLFAQMGVTGWDEYARSIEA